MSAPEDISPSQPPARSVKHETAWDALSVEETLNQIHSNVATGLSSDEVSLAMEPPSPNTMKRKPRHAESSLLSRDLIILIGWQSVMLAAIALVAYSWALEIYGPSEHARTIGLFTLIGVPLGYLFNCRSQTRSAFSNLFSNPYIWVATLIVVALQLMAVYVTPLSLVLGTAKPTRLDWIVVLGSVMVPIVVVEITKLVAALRQQTVKL